MHISRKTVANEILVRSNRSREHTDWQIGFARTTRTAMLLLHFSHISLVAPSVYLPGMVSCSKYVLCSKFCIANVVS
jgi:hypothetical protein